MRYLYLHGFASGPTSRKAQAFAAAMAAAGIHLEIPALDGGDFERLTITSQLTLIESLLANEPARLIGSSMGGYLAALYAASHPEIDRLVLMAPAFHFAARWGKMVGPDKLLAWETTGSMEFFHYGIKQMRRLGSGVLRDAPRYPAEPDFRQPALIFHGLHDETVPIELSRTFSSTHPNATLAELDSDHELTDVIGDITEAAVAFLSSKGTPLA